MSRRPRVLTFDIETSPITSYTWGLRLQNIGLNQIKHDWHILAWSAKWLHDPASRVMYDDNRNARDVRDDRRLVRSLVRLLNRADVVITQNGEAFDLKKVRARAVIHGLPPVRPCKSTDILKEGRKVFAFTSHKLEYVTGVLNTKYKKLKHDEYPGFELWSAVLRGDKRAWDVMKTYTIHDVLATEEAYQKIQGWIRTQDVSAFESSAVMRCPCGSARLHREGYAFTDAGKYQIFHCLDCGKWPRGTKNLHGAAKRKNTLRHWRGGINA